MYDWANSAYSTILITILHGYLTKVVFLPGDTWGPTFFAWGIGLSMFIAAALSPIVGAMADANCSKRKWLAGTALCGAACSVLLGVVPPEATVAVVALFVGASLMFELSLGFYNGFLPEISTEETVNFVSAVGYAVGYVGGALALGLASLVMIVGPSVGLPELADQLRVGIVFMGFWWGLFTVPTIRVLRDRGVPPERKEPMLAAAGKAVREVGHTLHNVRRYKMLALFLLGFLFYNDGVQTVLTQASTFATETPELRFSTAELVAMILMIQLVALPGALLVGRLADALGQKRILIICLLIWIALLVAAFFVVTKTQFWILGGVLALVMGGTQSVSRAIMGLMTPPDRTAEFFGFFNFSGKATSFMGTFLFGTIFKLTASPRAAILSLLLFFVIGLAIVAVINVREGRRQALQPE